MDIYDVAVIGAGLAGLHVARRLARGGLSVLLVERKPTPSFAVQTTGIFVRRTLEDFHLPEECLGPAIRHVTLYSPRRRALALKSPHAEFRVADMGRLYAAVLEDCRAAGVSVLLDTRYLGCETDCAVGQETRLRQSHRDSVLRLRLKARSREWCAAVRFLIGADGVCSRVAADLGLSRNREWIVGVENIYRGVPLVGSPQMHCFLDPRLAPGYIAWLVHDGRELHLGVGGYPARFQPIRALQEFRHVAQDHFDLSRAEFVEHRGGRIPVGGVLPRLANRHGLLVGDAAGAVSPLTAGGLDPCLRLSELAAEVIGQYLATGDERGLARYDGAEFRARFRRRRLMRWALCHIKSPAAFEAMCLALRSAPLRWAAERVFFGRGSFPDVAPFGERRVAPMWKQLVRPGTGG